MLATNYISLELAIYDYIISPFSCYFLLLDPNIFFSTSSYSARRRIHRTHMKKKLTK
jgi:hypothetical protein